MLVERGQLHGASEALEQALSLAPADQNVVRAYFDMLSDVKPPHELLTFAERHAADLRTPELLYKRGQLLARAQREEEALAVFHQAFELASDHELRRAIGYRLIVGLIRAHRTMQATALIDRLLAEYPDHGELLEAKRVLLSPDE
mgnify:FL=1